MKNSSVHESNKDTKTAGSASLQQEVRMKTLSGNIRGATEREMLHVSARFSLNTENSSVKQEKRTTSSAEPREQ